MNESNPQQAKDAVAHCPVCADLLAALRYLSDSLATIPLPVNAAIVRSAISEADAAIARAEGR